MRSRLVAGLTLLALLTVFSCCGYCVHLRSTITKREQEIAVLKGEAAGLVQELAVKPKEVIKLVEKEIPKEIIRTIKETGATPIASTKVEATSEAFRLPCPPSRLDEQFPQEPGLTPEIQFGLKLGLLIVGIDDKSVHYAGSLNARAFSHDPEWSQNIPFKPENVHFEVAVSQDVKDAMREHNRPWIKKHTSLNCPGVGVGYSLEEQKVTTFVGCTYGLSWF